MKNYDQIIFERLSKLLNECSDLLTNMKPETEEEYSAMLAGVLNVFENREIMDMYFTEMVHKLEPKKYSSNPYYMQVSFDEDIVSEHWTLGMRSYKPYEAFVCDEFITKDDGRHIPQIGYFEKEYSYPCVLQDGVEWMTITPNEINTMRGPIEKAHGKVITFGLGLGYFAIMTALSDKVDKVIVIEKDSNVIELFEKHILPCFSKDVQSKIEVLCQDAFRFSEELRKSPLKPCDYVFSDIWHDPSDGVELYKQLKSLERDDVEYNYWIEKTLKWYL